MYLFIVIQTVVVVVLSGVFAPDVFASTSCTGNVCASTNGTNVAIEQPSADCGIVQNSGGTGHRNILQGCNGSNYVQFGYGDDNNVREVLSQYGWTYTGTNDGYRYFTFGMTANYQPMVNYMWLEISDGTWDNCGGYVSGSTCNFDAHQDYLSEYQSPSAQMRTWVDAVDRPQLEAERYLESPLQGIANCQGSETGSASYTASASYGTNGGQIGASVTTTDNFYLDGLCNANSDLYSTYMNMNWSGDINGTHSMTTSAQTYEYITATDGSNNVWPFNLDNNMMVTWYNNDSWYQSTYDLFDDTGSQLPNGTYAMVAWSF